jgi:hypothetical protein
MPKTFELSTCHGRRSRLSTGCWSADAPCSSWNGFRSLHPLGEPGYLARHVAPTHTSAGPPARRTPKLPEVAITPSGQYFAKRWQYALILRAVGGLLGTDHVGQ